MTAARRFAAIERYAAQRRAEAAFYSLRDDLVGFGEACGLTLDPWQRDALASTAPRALWACGRQTGKSQTAAIIALHTAVYTPGATALCLSATQRQAQELFRKVLGLLGGLSAHSGGLLTVPTDAETQLTLRLSNGARVVALPASPGTVRSYRADLLLLDEAAHIPEDLYYATLPMLAVSHGRLIMLSSCYGKRGVFWEAWRGPIDGAEAIDWYRVRVPATECPRISPAFLEEMERTMGWWWFRSEFMAEFMDARTAAFREEDILAAFSEPYETWDLEQYIDK
jgi:hypothetical protein